MLLREITSNDEIDEGLTWARKGKDVVRKYRCVGGARHGRIVSVPGQCYARIDPKKRANIKRMKARLGKRLIRKTKRTKRTNPASRRVQAMNKSTRRRK
tara:strand:- start:817 stop:1113 length:297 start_codon:yes stop_codon:yes gene_type:complete